MTTSASCGTDLHILKGDVPSVTDGRILGHEGIGVIEEVGAGVTEFQVVDKVIISCITSCTKCEFCRRGIPSHCSVEAGSWVTLLTEPKLGRLAFHTPMEVSITFPREVKKKLW